MAATAGLKAASSGIWKSGGAGILQLVAPFSSQSGCCSNGSNAAGARRVGCNQQSARRHQSARCLLPPSTSCSIGGKAKTTTDPGLAAAVIMAATSHQSSSIEGIDTKSYLWARYHEMKKLVYDLLPPGVCNLLNPAAIYANNEISLGDVEIYGFDYDYTLAQYSNLLHSMIFNTARDILIEQCKYPEGLRKYDYIPGFAIRGLHYDVHKSLLMKIDAFHYVQLGTAYQGLKPVPDEEVIEMYGGTQHIPLYQMSDFYGKVQ